MINKTYNQSEIKNTTFYVIQENYKIKSLQIIEKLACNLSEISWRKGKKILISCQNEQQAYRIDKALWEQSPNTFIPHDLINEKQNHHTPIELTWKEEKTRNSAELLINLMPNFTKNSISFKEVIEFVPYETSLKILARKRYAIYKNLGFKMKIKIHPKTS